MSSQRFDFAKEVLIVIVCIGFMLGVLLRRCFPIMQRRFFLLVMTLVMLIAIIAKSALIAIVCASLILGILLIRCLPIIQRTFYLLVILLVMAVVPLGLVTWWLHEAAMGIDLSPLNLKLADCTTNVVNIHLKIPAGHDYSLGLITGTKKLKNRKISSSYTFSGHLRISSNGALIADLPIGSDKAWQNGSWFGLTGVGIQNTNVPPLSKFIQSHKSYDFEISFEPTPPPGSSIWFYCLVSGRDQ